MQRLLPLVLVLSLVLAGCGDDEPSDPFGAPNGDNPFGASGSNPFGNMPGDFDPNDPESAKKMVENMMNSAAKFELTDDNLEKLYEFAERLEKIQDSENPAAVMALYRESGWSMLKYSQAMMKLQGARSALRRGTEKTLKNYEQAKTRLAEAEEKLAAASAEEKPALEGQVRIAKMMLKGLEGGARAAEKLADPAYKAMIEKWIKKFDELEDR